MADDNPLSPREILFDFSDPYNLAFWVYLTLSLLLFASVLFGADIKPIWLSAFAVVFGLPLVLALAHQWYNGYKLERQFRREARDDEETGEGQ